MYPPAYYQSANGPMVTHALGHIMYGYTLGGHIVCLFDYTYILCSCYLYITVTYCIYIYIYPHTHIFISKHKQNAHNDGNRAQPLKWLLKTLFVAINKCTGFTTDVIWVRTKVCSVISEPTQSSSRRTLPLKDSSVLLTAEWWTSQKGSPSNR